MKFEYSDIILPLALIKLQRKCTELQNYNRLKDAFINEWREGRRQADHETVYNLYFVLKILQKLCRKFTCNVTFFPAAFIYVQI